MIAIDKMCKPCRILWLSVLLLTCISTQTQTYIELPEKATDDQILQAALSLRPSERQLAWQQLEYYGFIHFGINTFMDKEWGDGTASPLLFYPTELNAEQWAKTIKDAGMRGLILTAKHHDGFCLWPTATTTYSVASSPWRNGKGDLVREVADACRKYDLKFGVYLSPWDRNCPVYGDSPAYNKLYCQQLTELLTNYGEIFEVWFDGACGEGPNGKRQEYNWESYYALIRKLQPKAVIAIMGPDVRWVGNEAGHGRDPEWSVLPLAAAAQATIAQNSQQEELNGAFVPKNFKGEDLGSRPLLRNSGALIWYPSEVDTSIRPGWFYHSTQDDKVKSVVQLENIYFSSVGMNSSLLLNVPPDKRGLIHKNDVDTLLALRQQLNDIFAEDVALEAEVCEKLGKKIPVIQLTFADSVTFNTCLLQEDIEQGQRVERFVIEVKNGNKWMPVAEGKTIGYKRLLRFSDVRTHKMRVRFLDMRARPEIKKIALYMCKR